MKKFSKEYYDLLSQFERDLPKMPVYVGAKIERDSTNTGNSYYANGEINRLFITYMTGYEFGKFTTQ